MTFLNDKLTDNSKFEGIQKINFNKFLKKDYKQISICAFDAGAAAHISEWSNNFNCPIKYSLGGPALKIFRKENKDLINYDIQESLKGSQLHIAGTAWSSDYEISSIKLAKEHSIYTISVLDHWVSYKQRFLYKGEIILPDEIWVSDVIAKDIASKEFPTVKISVLPNLWMHKLIAKVKNSSLKLNREKNKPALNLLYLLEPIRSSKQWKTKYSDLSEFDALRYFFDRISILKKLNYIDQNQSKLNLRFRLHPSEKIEKYKNFLFELHPNIEYEISSSQFLEDDLAWCDIAFGIETQALICSLECGIISISTKPKWAEECSLPHEKLLHLSKLI